MAKIAFTVYGAPVAQPRQRHKVIDPGFIDPFAVNYTPARAPVNAWKMDCAKTALLYRRGRFVNVPLRLDIDFYLPRPQTLMRQSDPAGPLWDINKPDMDNLLKAVMDALRQVVYQDDALICELHAKKFYHEKDHGPRAVLVIEQLGALE